MEGESNAVGSVSGIAAYIKSIGGVVGNGNLDDDEGNGEC